MRTLRRTRDRARDTALTVVIALDGDHAVMPGDVVMLEDVGAALVLSVAPADGVAATGIGERALELQVEAFAPDNTAPDIP